MEVNSGSCYTWEYIKQRCYCSNLFFFSFFYFLFYFWVQAESCNMRFLLHYLSIITEVFRN